MAINEQQLQLLVNNPERGINSIIETIETNWFDKRVSINSKTHPFVLSLDLIAGTTHQFLNRIEDCIAAGYPVHARSLTELSPHMSSEESTGIFGNPSIMDIRLGIEENTLLASAVDKTMTVGNVSFTYKVLTIPKDTELTYNGYTFNIENAVEIRYSEKTGYQCVYNTDFPNPYRPINNNMLPVAKAVANGLSYIMVTIPFRQLKVSVNENKTSNVASGCAGEIAFEDNLYTTRAFLTQNGFKTEIDVRYNKDVFDPSTVTLSIEIDNVSKTLKYEIPSVYISNGLGVGIVDIYVYTTKGALTKKFEDLVIDSNGANYQDYTYGAGNLGIYSAPLKTIGSVMWRPIGGTSGGTTPLPFAEIKRRFLLGRRKRNLPITENNLVGYVEEYGYSTIKKIDYMTGRNFALTKELPRQVADDSPKNIYAPMSCFVGSHLGSVNSLVMSGVAIDNGRRVTIPQDAMFDITTDETILLPALTKNAYLNMTDEQKVDLLRNNTFVYTPFYYVIDTTDNQAVMRMYHLDTPTINYQSFKFENDALGIEVSVGAIGVDHTDTGYRISVITESGRSYKTIDDNSLGIQLSYIPKDSNTLASIKGRLDGLTSDGERIWVFDIDSRYDIDVNDVIYFNNFTQFGNVQDTSGSDLTQEFRIIFCVAGDNTLTNTDSDRKIDDTLFSSSMIAIIEMGYEITFGKNMNSIFSRLRPITGSAQYQRYTENIQDTYPETTYVYENGRLAKAPDGSLIVQHRKGDMMFTDSVPPQPIYKYLKDNIVYDENGNPVLLSPRELLYYWDFVSFDGAYRFSKDPYDVKFANDTKNYFTDIIDRDMREFGLQTIDQTLLAFQPRSKMGYQNVVVNSGGKVPLKQDLSFVVTYYLTKTGNKNANLKASLKEASPKVINELLFNTTTLPTNIFASKLKENVSDEVVTVKVTMTSGSEVIDVISNIDELTGFSVRKVLRLGGNGLLTIEEDIDTNFLLHDISDTGIVY